MKSRLRYRRKTTARKALRRTRRAPTRALTQAKVYKYNFSPNTQYLRNVEGNSPGIGGAYALSPNPSVVGAAPIALGTNYTVSPYPASSGLAGCYDFGMALNFQAFHIQTIGSYSSLFDMYRIDSVTVNVRYIQNGTLGQASVDIVSPTIYAIIDQDDSVIPLTSNELARQGRRIFKFDNKSRTDFKITINRPKRSSVMNMPPSTGTANAIVSNGWCDMANLKMAHYGLKLWVENMSCPDPKLFETAFEFTYQYKLSFKGNRNQY
jgi:hypothetical protein